MRPPRSPATLALAAGCSKPAPAPVQEAAPAATPAVSTGNATIVGHGPRPNPGAQIVVVLEPTTSRSFPPQTDVPVMDQVGLTFGPPAAARADRAAGRIPQQRRYVAQRARHARGNARTGLQRRHPHRQLVQVHISERRLLSGRMRHPPGDGGIGLFRLDAVRDARGARRAVHDRGCRAGRLHGDACTPAGRNFNAPSRSKAASSRSRSSNRVPTHRRQRGRLSSSVVVPCAFGQLTPVVSQPARPSGLSACNGFASGTMTTVS